MGSGFANGQDAVIEAGSVLANGGVAHTEPAIVEGEAAPAAAAPPAEAADKPLDRGQLAVFAALPAEFTNPSNPTSDAKVALGRALSLRFSTAYDASAVASLAVVAYFAYRALESSVDERSGTPRRAALALAVPPGPVAEARHVVVKSVHCALSIEWIVQRFSPTVLVVERDPRNVMASWMDLGMGGDRRENEVLARVASERWGLEAPPSDASKLVQRTFVFGVLATALREAAQRNPTWIVASHDDLCRDPEPKFAALLERLGLEYGEAAHEYVVGSDRAGEGFRTQRRTRDQPEKWRERLTPEDAAAIEQELDRFPVRLIGHD